MTVTKRTRYEVLRRDGHTCRYCGARAPEAVLTVDHVTPVSLGGTDDPGNLVAACKDCNAGKSSSSPDAGTVEQVSDDALRWSQAMRWAINAQVLEYQDRHDYTQTFVDAWSTWDEPLGHLDPAFEGSLMRWMALGFPVELVVEAMYIATANKKVRAWDVWRYMCGIVWNRLRKAQEAASDSLGKIENPRQADPSSILDDFIDGRHIDPRFAWAA